MPQEPCKAGRAAERGTELHTVVECRLNGEDAPLPDWASKWPIEGVLKAIRELHGVIEAEVAFGFDGERSRRLKGGQREYLGGDGMICGTADQVSYDGARVIVSDLKTGEWPVSAHDNAQLQALAVMAAGCDKRRRIDRATVAIVQCSASSDHDYEIDVGVEDYDAIDLACYRAELRELMRSIEAARVAPYPMPGEHCRFCPVDNCNKRKGF